MSNSPDAINKRVQGWRKMEVIDVGDGNNIIRPEKKNNTIVGNLLLRTV
jgi:hypothetical protein